MRLVIEAGGRSWVEEVPDGPVGLGRALTNAVVLDDTGASREHCRLVPGDAAGEVWLEDLGSRNGTRLNGRRVERARLQAGDRIQVGETTITLAGADGDDPGPGREELSAEVLRQDPLTGLASFPALVAALERALTERPEAGSPRAESPDAQSPRARSPEAQSPRAESPAAQSPRARSPEAQSSDAQSPRAERREPRSSWGVALVRFDLDYLGLLNDMFGFEAGDRVIRDVGRAIDGVALRAGGGALTAGLGDGSYAVLLPGLERDAAVEVAEQARSEVAALRFDGPLGAAAVTVSAGVAVAPADGDRWRTLLRRSQVALAEAKRSGRDQVVDAAALPERERRVGPPASLGETRAWPAMGGPSPTGDATQALTLSHAGQSFLGLVAHALGSDLDLEPLLELVGRVLLEATGAKRGFVLLRTAPGQPLRLRGAVAADGSPTVWREGAVSQGVVRQVEGAREPLVLDDVQADPGLGKRQSVVAEGLRSLIGVPLRWGDEALGVLILDDPTRVGAFDAAARELATACGQLIAGPIRRLLVHAAQHEELERARAALARSAAQEALQRHRYANIVGESPALERVLRLLDRLADTSAPVLIHGESGTGKELIAAAIHYNSGRAAGPFVAENCGALPDSLLEAELFGHVRGAFTGAERDRVGLFEAASGGTLFLDEIGETSPAMQVKLLRVLQEGEVRPVGARDVRQVDVRLVAATNRDLLAAVAAGSFREDLYYRVAVMTVDLPPLRERREDVPLLLEHFLAAEAEAADRPVPDVSREALALLVHHAWPGNVRELQNEAKKLLALVEDRVLPRHLSPRIRGDERSDGSSVLGRAAVSGGADAMELMLERGEPLAAIVTAFERELIARVLEAAEGNRSETARRLGLSRPGLLKKMKRYGLS